MTWVYDHTDAGTGQRTLFAVGVSQPELVTKVTYKGEELAKHNPLDDSQPPKEISDY